MVRATEYIVAKLLVSVYAVAEMRTGVLESWKHDGSHTAPSIRTFDEKCMPQPILFARRALLLIGLPLCGFIILLAGLPSPSVVAAPGVQQVPPVTWLGSIGGAMGSVAVSGTIAYIGDGAALTVLDVSHPSRPVPIARLPLPDLVEDIQVVGAHLHIATGFSGVQIIDGAHPSSPQLLTVVDTPGYAQRTVTVDNLLYVADGRAGVVTLDIADLQQVKTLSVLPLGEAIAGVQWVNGWLYAWDINEGLFIVDVTQPTAPTVRRQLAMNLFDVDVSGAFAYFTQHATMVKYDISQPDAPHLLATYDLGSPHRAAVANDLVYVITYGTLAVLDPQSTMPTGLIAELTLGHPVALWVQDELAFVVDGDGELEIVDIRQRDSLASVGKHVGIAGAFALAVVSDTVYLANIDQGVQVIDIADPEHPTQIAAARFRPGAYDLAVKDRYLYVAAGQSDLKIFALTDTVTPTLVYTYTALPGAYQVEIAGNIAFVTSGGGGLIYIFDVSEPAVPVLRSSVSCTHSCRIAVSLPWLYVSNEKGFDIFYVDEPYFPRLSGSYTIENLEVPNPSTLIAAGNYVLLPTGYEPFVDVVDVTSATTPVLFARRARAAATILRSQHYGFLVGGEAAREITVFTLADAPRLAVRTSLTLPYFASEIVVADNRLIVADGSAGLQIFALNPTGFTPELFLPFIAR